MHPLWKSHYNSFGFILFLHTLFFKRTVQLSFPQAHNGSQCSHWWEPVFIRGPLPVRFLHEAQFAAAAALTLCSRQWLTSLLPRHCPTFRSDRSPPWQRWLAHVQSLSVQPWWRGRSRTRAMFNEPGSQGQNKDSIDNSKCWDFGDPGQVLLCQWFYRFNKTCDAIC